MFLTKVNNSAAITEEHMVSWSFMMSQTEKPLQMSRDGSRRFKTTVIMSIGCLVSAHWGAFQTLNLPFTHTISNNTKSALIK